MNSVTFTNDNNVNVILPSCEISNTYKNRDKHEVMFRKIVTFLINKSYIEKNIYDVGCWIGDNVIPWSMNVRGTVYAFDPSDENINYIRQLSNINNIKNVKLFKTAISDKDEILYTNDNITHCSFVWRNSGIKSKNSSKSTYLDKLYSSNEIELPDFVHIDVEGMEMLVIRGMKNIITKSNPIIAFEQHLNREKYMDIVKHIETYGYTVFIINEVLLGCDPDCRNFLAIPNSKLDKIINDIRMEFGNNLLITPN